MRKLFLVAMAALLAACTTVKPGYVGIKVNNYGSGRGVQDLPIVTGLVWYNPFSTDIYDFPTFIQTQKWTRSQDEGSAKDQSITFNSLEGATVNVDVGLSISFNSRKVPEIFQQFREEPQTIIDGYIRNQVRDAFSINASKMKITDIFGQGKQALIDSVASSLKRQLSPMGIIIDNVSVIGEMRVDREVQSSINAVLTATQRAIEAENKIKQSQAEADQRIQVARGDSAAAVIEASGKAHANEVLARSVTPELIEYQKWQKWDGVLPQVTGGAPLINVPNREH